MGVSKWRSETIWSWGAKKVMMGVVCCMSSMGVMFLLYDFVRCASEENVSWLWGTLVTNGRLVNSVHHGRYVSRYNNEFLSTCT